MMSEKAPVNRKPLYDMFSEIPPRYDLINTIITWNMDTKWRQKAARECLSFKPKRILDLCCGTGDLAISIAKSADYTVEVKGLDYSQPMLDIAAVKAAACDVKGITFTQATASRLPFEDAFFECIGISFAFRNLTYDSVFMTEHLSEILRVLETGGRFVIVESSQPKSKAIRSIFHFYLRQYVFRVGWLISGSRQAYRYLSESASHYYPPDEIQGLLIKAGFSRVSFIPLLFGVAGIHVAIK
jgi:demethylmenaquinone methyltransferase / 2-methoxy-6-polyprenyl-1,4-benzoquinol methylase